MLKETSGLWNGPIVSSREARNLWSLNEAPDGKYRIY